MANESNEIDTEEFKDLTAQAMADVLNGDANTDAAEDIRETLTADKGDDGDVPDDPPDWHRGMTNLAQAMMAQAKSMSRAVDKSAGPAIQRGDFAVRNASIGEKESMLEGAKAFADGQVATSPVGSNLPTALRDNSTAVKGSGELTVRGIMHSLEAVRNAKHLDRKTLRQQAKSRGDKAFCKLYEEKDVQATDASQGGSMIPTELSEDFVQFLHGQTTVRQLGPETMSLDGPLEIGRQDQTVTSRYGSENFTVNASEPGTDKIRLEPKELKITVLFSNQFLSRAPQAAQDLLRSDLPRKARATEEQAVLRSPGTQGEPEGLRFLASSANRDVDTRHSSGSNKASLSQINQDLLGLLQQIYGAGNVQKERPALILQHRTAMGLRGVTDGEEQLSPFVPMLNEGRLHGAQVGITSQLPTNLDVDSTGKTDHTEAYAVEMSEFIIGDEVSLQIDETQEGTLIDANGNRVSTFERDMTGVRLIHRSDTALKHADAAANLKNVDWGADYA